MDDIRVRELVVAIQESVRMLERELDRGDNYQIGAALSKLKKQLSVLAELAHLGEKRQNG